MNGIIVFFNETCFSMKHACVLYLRYKWLYTNIFITKPSPVEGFKHNLVSVNAKNSLMDLGLNSFMGTLPRQLD